jgi:hypothetical protein
MLNFLKKYGAHLTGYVMAAATIVSGINPKILPPQYSFISALAGLVVVASHHGYAAGSANAVITAAANAASNAVKLTPVVLAIFMLPFLHGCASTQAFLSSPTGQEVVVAGVKIAVATAETKGVPAAQLNSVAKQLLADDTGAAATLTALTAAFDGEMIKLNIPAADVIAFQGLEVAFDAYITAKYGSNATVQNVQADLALFLTQVIADTGG